MVELIAGMKNVRKIPGRSPAVIFNKAGRGAFTGSYKGYQCKAYEAFSSSHAGFIVSLSELEPDIFPNVIEARGNWVIADWQRGRSAGRSSVEGLGRLLASIHQVDVNKLPLSGFNYWHDFVVPRFMRAVAFLSKAGEGEEILRLVEGADRPPVLQHPDVTLPNIIICNDGAIRSIDNELVAVGTLPVLDLMNSIASLRGNQRGTFYKCYAEQAGRTFTKVEIERAALAWVVRTVGSSFISGDLKRAESLLLETSRPSTLIQSHFPILRTMGDG